MHWIPAEVCFLYVRKDTIAKGAKPNVILRTLAAMYTGNRGWRYLLQQGDRLPYHSIRILPHKRALHQKEFYCILAKVTNRSCLQTQRVTDYTKLIVVRMHRSGKVR